MRRSTRPRSGNFARLAFAVLLAMFAPGCAPRDAVRVELLARALPKESLVFLQIEAQIAGPVDGLRYKWFAVSGECEPQESDQPKTVFKFPEGVRQDRVSVEVWRGNRRVAQNEIKVKFDEERARREQATGPEAHIEITRIPPSEPGGPQSRASIAGKVTGTFSPDDLVVIYVRASGFWYVQPEAGSVHDIKPDSNWETWTHTGTRYAALLVRPGFEPLMKLDMLPQTNKSILSVDIVDGLPRQRLTNAGPAEAQPAQ